MRLFRNVLVVLLFTPWLACNVVELFEPKFYAGCCAQSSVQDSIGTITFVIPNAITPNEDEINDAFAIYCSRPLLIRSLSVSEQNGNLAIDRSNIRIQGWTDIWVPKNASGISINGIYNYTLTLQDENGAEKNVTGQFCALSCVEKDADIIPFEACDFQTQSNDFGQLIDSLPNLEPCE